MGKHWARQQVRQDELQDTLSKGVDWASKNRQQAGIGAGVLIGALLIGGLAFYRWQANREDAWDRLGLAEAASFQGNNEMALQQIDELIKQQPGSIAAGYGLLFAGDLHYPKGEYKEAVERYNQLIERGQPKQLVPYALNDLAITQQAAGQYPDAEATARRFLDEFPDHFLAPQVHSALARSLMAEGKTDDAKAALQKIALQYPDTSFAAWAQSQLQPNAPAKK